MARTLNRRPPQRQARSKKTETEFDREGTLNLDASEKHEMVQDLIMHHAALRPRPSAGIRWACRAGVLVSCVAVFSGWALTVQNGLKINAPTENKPGIVELMRQSYDKVTVEQGQPVEKIQALFQDPQTEDAKRRLQTAILNAIEQASSTASSTNP